jgi:hypothetical protein
MLLAKKLKIKLLGTHFSSFELANIFKTSNYSAQATTRYSGAGDSVAIILPLTICSNLFSGNNENSASIYIYTMQHSLLK